MAAETDQQRQRCREPQFIIASGPDSGSSNSFWSNPVQVPVPRNGPASFATPQHIRTMANSVTRSARAIKASHAFWRRDPASPRSLQATERSTERKPPGRGSGDHGLRRRRSSSCPWSPPPSDRRVPFLHLSRVSSFDRSQADPTVDLHRTLPRKIGDRRVGARSDEFQAPTAMNFPLRIAKDSHMPKPAMPMSA